MSGTDMVFSGDRLSERRGTPSRVFESDSNNRKVKRTPLQLVILVFSACFVTKSAFRLRMLYFSGEYGRSQQLTPS